MIVFVVNIANERNTSCSATNRYVIRLLPRLGLGP